ncbi:MAG: hypothetical protein QXO35_00355 [Candidatus Micrarchaeia archaeon]
MQEKEYLRFYKNSGKIERLARITLASLLLVEPLILPLNAKDTSIKGFKNQMSNTIKVERMGDKVSAQKTINLEKKKIEVKNDIDLLLKGSISYATIAEKRIKDKEYEKEWKNYYDKLDKKNKQNIDNIINNTLPQEKIGRLKNIDVAIQDLANAQGLHQINDMFYKLIGELNKQNLTLEDTIVYLAMVYKGDEYESLRKAFLSNLEIPIREIYENFNKINNNEKIDIKSNIFDPATKQIIKNFQKRIQETGSSYIETPISIKKEKKKPLETEPNGTLDLKTIETILLSSAIEKEKHSNIDSFELYLNANSQRWENETTGHFDSVAVIRYKDGTQVIYGINYNKTGDYSYSKEYFRGEWPKDPKKRKVFEAEASDLIDTLFGGKGGRPSYYRYYSTTENSLLTHGINAKTGAYFILSTKTEKDKSLIYEMNGDPNFFYASINEKITERRVDPTLWGVYQGLLQTAEIAEKAGIPSYLGNINNCTVKITTKGKSEVENYKGEINWKDEVGYRISNPIIEVDESGKPNVYVWMDFVKKGKDDTIQVVNSYKIPTNTPTPLAIENERYNIEIIVPKAEIAKAIDKFMQQTTLIKLNFRGMEIAVEPSKPIELRDEKGNKYEIFLQISDTGMRIGSRIELKAKLDIAMSDSKGTLLDNKSVEINIGEDTQIPVQNQMVPIKVSLIQNIASMSYMNYIDSKIEMKTIRYVNENNEEKYITNVNGVSRIGGSKGIATITSSINYLTTEPIQSRGIFNLTKQGNINEITADDYKDLMLKWEERNRKQALATMRGWLGETTMIGGMIDYRRDDGTGVTLFIHDGKPLIDNGIATNENLQYMLNVITKGFRVIDKIKVTGFKAERKEELQKKTEEEERRDYLRREKSIGVIGSIDYHFEKILNLSGLWNINKKSIDEWAYEVDTYLSGKGEEFRYQTKDPNGSGLTVNKIYYNHERIYGESKAGEKMVKGSEFSTVLIYNTIYAWGAKIQPGFGIEKMEKTETTKFRGTLDSKTFDEYLKTKMNPYTTIFLGNTKLDFGYSETKIKDSYKYSNNLNIETSNVNKIYENLVHIGMEIIKTKIFGLSTDITGYYEGNNRNSKWFTPHLTREEESHNKIYFFQPTFELKNNWLLGIGFGYSLQDWETKEIEKLLKGERDSYTLRINATDKDRFTGYFELIKTDYKETGYNPLSRKWSSVITKLSAETKLEENVRISGSLSLNQFNYNGKINTYWSAHLGLKVRY